MSNHPTILQTVFDWRKASQAANSPTEEGPLEPKLLELVRLRVAQICNCQLGVDAHTEFLEALGESTERIQQLESWHSSSLYDRRERIALAVSEALGSDPPSPIYKDIVHAARAQFNDAEILQLALTIFAVADWSHQCVV